MKLKLKALAAAVALVAGIGSANAAIDTFAGGNGSLVAFVVDAGTGVSALFDLGLNLNDFTTGSAAASANQTWNLAGGDYSAAWTSFSAAANMGSSMWGVIAGDSFGSGAGAKRFLSTTNAAESTVKTQLTGPLLAFTNVDSFLTASNSLGNHGAVANGANVAFAATDGNAYEASGGAMGAAQKWQNNAVFNATAALDSQLNFFMLTNAANSLTKANVTQYKYAGDADYFKLASDGTLTYTAAVPEPGTWAMLAAGLLMVGGIARRRMSV